jgi:hypothetical protein
MAALTPTEEAKALRYLGYPNWSALAASYQLGYPAPSQPEYLVRDSFVRINDEGLAQVRIDLCQLDSIQAQIAEARGRMKASKIGNLTINQDEIPQLRREFNEWKAQLATDLGVYRNPYDQTGRSGGRNAAVRNG